MCDVSERSQTQKPPYYMFPLLGHSGKDKTVETENRLGVARDWRASLVAQRLKHLPAMWETWVRSLGQEDPLEKEMATHSSILAWRIPWTEEPGRLPVHGIAKSRTWHWIQRNARNFSGVMENFCILMWRELCNRMPFSKFLWLCT